MSSTPPPSDPHDPAQPGPGGYPTYPGAGEGQPAPGGYPTHPGTPPGGGGGHPGGTARDVPQPSSISTAVKLMWVGAGLSALSLLFSLFTIGSMKDKVREQVLESDPSASQAMIDAAFAFGIISGIVGGLLSVLVWAWMAWKNGQGRSWARIVATVLGGLNVLFTPLSFAVSNAEPISLVFSVINLVLAIVILILLWRKPSSEFYAARSRAQLI